MKIVFFGNNIRGTLCLESVLDAGWNVVGVVAHPTSSALFGKTVENVATEHNLPLYQPSRVNSSEFVKVLKGLEPDLCILAGYSQIVKKALIDVPKLGIINLHGGLVPKYRGSSITRWVIINGEEVAGVSILEVNEGIDTGPIIAQEQFRLPVNVKVRDVLMKQQEIFPGLLLSTLEAYAEKTVKKVHQSLEEGCYWHALKAQDGRICWEEMTAIEILRRVNAFGEPYVGAFCYYDGEEIRILEASIPPENFGGMPGRICAVRDDGVIVMTRQGAIHLQRIRIQQNEENARGQLAVGKSLS